MFELIFITRQVVIVSKPRSSLIIKFKMVSTRKKIIKIRKQGYHTSKRNPKEGTESLALFLKNISAP